MYCWTAKCFKRCFLVFSLHNQTDPCLAGIKLITINRFINCWMPLRTAWLKKKEHFYLEFCSKWDILFLVANSGVNILPSLSIYITFSSRLTSTFILSLVLGRQLISKCFTVLPVCVCNCKYIMTGCMNRSKCVSVTLYMAWCVIKAFHLFKWHVMQWESLFSAWLLPKHWPIKWFYELGSCKADRPSTGRAHKRLLFHFSLMTQLLRG